MTYAKLSMIERARPEMVKVEEYVRLDTVKVGE